MRSCQESVLKQADNHTRECRDDRSPAFFLRFFSWRNSYMAIINYSIYSSHDLDQFFSDTKNRECEISSLSLSPSGKITDIHKRHTLDGYHGLFDGLLMHNRIIFIDLTHTLISHSNYTFLHLISLMWLLI